MTQRISKKTQNLLNKAKESVLLAVDIYNKPKTVFRTGGFVVLMCIGWTSLLHAIFEKGKISYFYKQNGQYIKIDGDKKAWDLKESVNKFFNSEINPVRDNILLFCELRNKIEHRFMPEIDAMLSGECQALLLNFEELLTQEFGENHSIIENLFIPLQLTRQKKSLPKKMLSNDVIKFIQDFRSALTSEVANSQNYSFQAFFIPKLGNHRSSSDVSIEFIKFDPNRPEEMEKYQRLIVGIRENTIEVANKGKYRPGDIYPYMTKKLNLQHYFLESQGKFLNWHTQMWKKYQVRPVTNSQNPKQCKTEYCQYDEAHKDYIYTDAWVDLLKSELQDATKD